MSKKHKHNDHEEHADETWLIPYADLLTLLLALFIVLYAMSSVDAKKFEELSKAFNIAFNTGSGVLENPTVLATGEQLNNDDQTKNNVSWKRVEEQLNRQALIKKEQEDLEKLKRQLDQYIEKNGLKTQLETKLNHTRLMITISDNALFASGSAVLKQESRVLAVAIGDMLAGYPDYEILVAGHTDNQPIRNAEFESNWELSSKRAIRFMNILLDNRDLDRKRFSAVAYGEYQPVDTNATELGRSKNRRVEVSIIRKYIDVEQAEKLGLNS